MNTKKDNIESVTEQIDPVERKNSTVIDTVDTPVKVNAEGVIEMTPKSTISIVEPISLILGETVDVEGGKVTPYYFEELLNVTTTNTVAITDPIITSIK